MPRQYFTKVSRQFRQKEQPWYLHPFRYILSHPVYFSANRRSVCRAIWIGVFCAFIPIPGQTLVAVLAALGARVNIPVSAIGVWVTNPLTMAPLFYLAYRLGATLLNVPLEPFPSDFSIEAIRGLGSVWTTTLYGGLFLGLASATLAYISASAIWRLSTASRYRMRRAKRNNEIQR